MKKVYKLIFIPVVWFAANSVQAQYCHNCGTGADGVYTATLSDTLHGGTYNFTSFTIGANDTIKVKGIQPLVIYCAGKVIINGILDASGGSGSSGIAYDTNGFGGIGVAGGMNGGNGIYSSVTGPLIGSDGSGTGYGSAGAGWYGGGGAGFAHPGDSSFGNSGSGFGGIAYGSANLIPTLGGSGGGGGSGGYSCGSGGGGAGGGIIVISTCDSIIIGANGAIKANGGNGGSDGAGNCGGGGGGSGGSIWLMSNVLDNNGRIQADSGLGGASSYSTPGGNGAEGRIRIDKTSIVGAGSVSPSGGYSASSILSVTIDSLVSAPCGSSLWAVANGGNPIYTYMWTPGGATSDTINNKCVGNYSVIVTDSLGCRDSAKVSLVVTGIGEIKSSESIHVYPVPTSEVLNVDVKDNFFGLNHLSIFDVSGRKISDAVVQPKSTHITVDVSKLDNGIYILKLIGNTSIDIVRFEVSK